MSYQLRQWMMPAQYYDIYDLVSDMYRGDENTFFHKFFFQATINLLIGYEPPANATPNLNDQPDGDMSQVDAGKLTVNLRN